MVSAGRLFLKPDAETCEQKGKHSPIMTVRSVVPPELDKGLKTEK